MELGKLLLRFLSILSGDQATTSTKSLEKSSESMSNDSKKPTMKLSKNFWLSEFIKSQYAERNGIDNMPDAVEIGNLKAVCMNVLQQVRDKYNRPIIVNSGYRAPKVNIAIGGSKNSQHCNGEAVDFEIPGLDNREVAKWIASNLSFDQLILEFYDKEKGINSGWIHVSYRNRIDNRHQCLSAKRVNGKTKYSRMGMEF